MKRPLSEAPATGEMRIFCNVWVYTALTRYDTAIEAGMTYLLDKRGDKAATHNHLGIAYYLKGETTLAAVQFQQAAELKPEDSGIKANLDRALRALGRGDASEPVAAVQFAATDSSKASLMEGAQGGFYWIE